MTRRHPPATANPPPSIHRKQLQPIGTTPTAESAFGSLPLHLSKITTRKGPMSPAQTHHSRSPLAEELRL
jgi:hypothetical protein